MWNSSCEIIFFPTFRCLYWIFCNMHCNVKTKTLWMTRLQFEVELWSNRKPSSKYHLVQTQQRSGGCRAQAEVRNIHFSKYSNTILMIIALYSKIVVRGGFFSEILGRIRNLGWYFASLWLSTRTWVVSPSLEMIFRNASSLFDKK